MARKRRRVATKAAEPASKMRHPTNRGVEADSSLSDILPRGQGQGTSGQEDKEELLHIQNQTVTGQEGQGTSGQEAEEERFSSFELLAEDAKGIIYRLAPEALNSLRMTSATMLKSVSEWATLANLPPVDLLIDVDSSIVVEIIVTKSVYDCFPCLHVFKLAECATAIRTPPAGSVLLRTEIHSCGIRLVREHLPLRLRSLEVRIVLSRGASRCDTEVPALLSRVKQIGELVARFAVFNWECVTLIEALTTKHRMRRLKLSVGLVIIPNAQNVAIALAGRVTDIELRQEDSQRSYDTMFGQPRADWGEVAVRMFKAGVERVTLINTDHFGFITKNGVDRVREYLAVTPSKHVFLTTFDKLAFEPFWKVLELPVNQIPHYKMGRWKHANVNLGHVNYLRYRHEDLSGDVIDDEWEPIPICQPYPGCG